VKQGLSLDGLRRRSGLTFRQLSGITGINLGRTHRGVTDPANARRGDVQQLRRAMADVIRRRRSSEPELLRDVQERAVPFLRGRSRA